MKKLSLLLQLLLVSLFIGAQPLQRVSPASVGLDASRLANADAAILKAIQHKDIPGAVLAVVRHATFFKIEFIFNIIFIRFIIYR